MNRISIESIEKFSYRFLLASFLFFPLALFFLFYEMVVVFAIIGLVSSMNDNGQIIAFFVSLILHIFLTFYVASWVDKKIFLLKRQSAHRIFLLLFSALVTIGILYKIREAYFFMS